MKPKIVFFDCDGVLITSNTWTKILDLVNFPKDLEQKLWNNYYSGKIDFKSWINAQTVYFKKYFNKKLYIEEVINKIELNPEAIEIVAFLKSQNIPVAIISSGEYEYVKATAEKLDIKLFRVNTYYRFDEKGKFTKMDFLHDDPISKVIQVREICEQFKCLPEETLFIGDSNNDLKAFKLTKHGLLYKTKDEDCLKFAWKIIENLNEIKNFI